MEYVQLTLDDWMEMKHKLKMELQGVKQSFVRIGYALRQMDDQKLYERDGYKSIAEFAKAEVAWNPQRYPDHEYQPGILSGWVFGTSKARISRFRSEPA